MANPEHVAKLKEGVEAWNRWRKANPDLGADLKAGIASSPNLPEQYKIDLRRSRLSKMDLQGADLSFTDLYRASLWQSARFE